MKWNSDKVTVMKNIINQSSENMTNKSSFGKNQKKSGDQLQNDLVKFLKCNYPNSNIRKEVSVYGSYKKSKKTGKVRPKLNKVDVIWDKIAISAKNQLTAGTSEQKIIYELCVMSDYIMRNPDTLEKAYIVYNGDGIKIIQEEIGSLPIFIELTKTHFQKIEIISFENFKKRHKNDNITS